MHPHQKYNHVSCVSICYGHIDYTFGGGGESRTPVQNALLYNFVHSRTTTILDYLPRARLVARRAACLTGLPLR